MSILKYLKGSGELKLPQIHKPIFVYTDGSCFDNGKRKATGGVGVVFPDHMKLNVSEALPGEQATNNRAEMWAIIRAIEVVEQIIDPKRKMPMIIKTDSKLCENTLMSWMKTWKAKGWKKYDGRTPKNLDLLKILDKLMTGRCVTVEHVKAHTGGKDHDSYFNDIADSLARNANKVK